MTTSVYTPSLVDHATLEALFVARHDELEQIAQRIDAAAGSSTRNHTLLIGPRGAGKTHLVTLAHHRARERVAAGLRVRLAWLPEDPWAITSYQRLLRAILVATDRAVSDAAAPDEQHAEHRLLADGADGPLVLFVENLDQILDAIGNRGQQRLRHLAQSGALLLVATTTSLSRALTAQDSPFYGFFTETRLRPLDIDDATEMLVRIAEQRGRADTVAELRSPANRPRLETVAHLAGGQPRVWSILADALVLDSTGSATDTLLATFDRLTPYYQEQLGRLSANQRLIVSELVDADRAMTVKDLAAATGIDQRSLSRTLIELRDRAWVREVDSPVIRLLKDRRVTYYELAEPLARIVFQMKTTKDGGPVRLLVDFLLLWFPSMSPPPSGATPSLVRELEVIRGLLHQGTLDLDEETLLRAFNALIALRNGDPTHMLGLSNAMRAALESALRRDPPEQIALRIVLLAFYAHRPPSMSQLKEILYALPEFAWYFSPIVVAREGRYRAAARESAQNSVQNRTVLLELETFVNSLHAKVARSADQPHTIGDLEESVSRLFAEFTLATWKLHTAYNEEVEALFDNGYSGAIVLALKAFRAEVPNEMPDRIDRIDPASLDRSLYDAELPPSWARQ